jgi:hypothetical protein
LLSLFVIALAVGATLSTAQPLLIKGNNEDSSKSCEDWELSTPRWNPWTQLSLKDKLQFKMRQQSQ